MAKPPPLSAIQEEELEALEETRLLSLFLFLSDDGDPHQPAHQRHESQGQKGGPYHLEDRLGLNIQIQDIGQAGDGHPKEQGGTAHRHDDDGLVVDFPVTPGSGGPDRLTSGADAQGAGGLAGQQILGFWRLLVYLQGLRKGLHCHGCSGLAPSTGKLETRMRQRNPGQMPFLCPASLSTLALSGG